MGEGVWPSLQLSDSGELGCYAGTAPTIVIILAAVYPVNLRHRLRTQHDLAPLSPALTIRTNIGGTHCCMSAACVLYSTLLWRTARRGPSSLGRPSVWHEGFCLTLNSLILALPHNPSKPYWVPPCEALPRACKWRLCSLVPAACDPPAEGILQWFVWHLRLRLSSPATPW